MFADKAYSSRFNRYLRRRRIHATIPIKLDQQANRRKRGSRGGRPPKFDALLYRLRHAVECGINLLEQFRAVTTRQDKPAVRDEVTTHIAAIDLWLRLRNGAGSSMINTARQIGTVLGTAVVVLIYGAAPGLDAFRPGWIFVGAAAPASALSGCAIGARRNSAGAYRPPAAVCTGGPTRR